MFLIFFLFTLLFLLAGACWVKVMYISTQEGQWLGGWQKVLAKLHATGHYGLAKMWGDCEVCFSNFLTMLWYIPYSLFMNKCLGFWITDLLPTGSLHLPLLILTNLIWFLVFSCTGAILSLYILVKLFK
jgi:hypothetical protein